MSTSFATLADAFPAELRGDGPPRGAEEHPRSPAHVSRPSRIPVYHPPAQVHAMPPPDGPDRTLAVAGNDNEGPTLRKRKARLADTSPEQKAQAVAIVLELRNDGKTLVDAAAEINQRLGFDPSPSILSAWVMDARTKNKNAHIGSDIASISQQLSAALDNVRQLKRKLKELLGDDE